MQHNVLIIASFANSILNFRGNLIRSLIKSGYSVHVAAPQFSELIVDLQKLEDMGVYVHDLSFDRAGVNPFKDISTFINLYKLMKRIKPNTVIVYTIKPVIYGLITAWLARVSNRYAIITGLGYVFTDTTKHNRLIKFVVRLLYRFSAKFAKKLFFQNPDDQQLFQKLKIIDPDRRNAVQINGSGVDLEEFTHLPLPNEIRFLMISRLLTSKGVREYVEAAKIVRKSHPNVRFSLVGWLDHGNPDSIEQTELNEWISNRYIIFLGKKDDVRPSIADSSVFVLPSYREGLPRTVLEAMSMGRPIITTDAPGCRETVKEGWNGFKVDVKSIDQLADRMCLFIQRPEIIKKMGKCSRKMAEKKFDVNKVNNILLEEMNMISR